jgi:hypothetical protein
MLESHGWSLQRINGSHHIYAKADTTAAFPFQSMEMNRSRPGFNPRSVPLAAYILGS